jgi:hypothetical protein
MTAHEYTDLLVSSRAIIVVRAAHVFVLVLVLVLVLDSGRVPPIGHCPPIGRL